jgi:hypothetical protein
MPDGGCVSNAAYEDDSETSGSAVVLNALARLSHRMASVPEELKQGLGEMARDLREGLRLSADVPWLARNVPGEERVMEFETKADEVVNVPGVPLLAVCQYHLSEVDTEETMEILNRHPLTLIGGRVLVNEHYTGRN